jgi:hypothetical protein
MAVLKSSWRRAFSGAGRKRPSQKNARDEVANRRMQSSGHAQKYRHVLRYDGLTPKQEI